MFMDEDSYASLKQTADTVVPIIEDVCDTSVGVPDFLGAYNKAGVGMKYIPADEYNHGMDPDDDRDRRRHEYGSIKVFADPLTSFGQVTSVAHELGHALLYQNTDFYDMRDDPAYDDTVRKGISEAVAYDVERRVKHRYLKEHATEPSVLTGSILPYTLTRTRYRIEDSVENPHEQHVLGRRILHEHGPVVEDAVADTQQLYDDVVAELDGHLPDATTASPATGAVSDD